MEPEDFDDFDDDTLSVDPDEDTLGLDWDESDAQSVARDLGIVTSEL
jgi:hypothetical protein